MCWLLLLFLTLVTVAWVSWRIKNRRRVALSKNFPGPATLPILGNALMFMCQPDELVSVFKKMMLDYGDMVRVWLGPDLNFVVSGPDSIKGLLSNNKTNAKGPQYRFMADIIGAGILSGSGPTWRLHRKLATPNYGKKAIESYGDIFDQEVDLLLNKYRNAETSEEINIYKFIVQTTSYSVCQTLMGLTREETINLPYLQELIDSTNQIYDLVFDRMTKWWLQLEPVFRCTSYYSYQQNIKQMVKEFSKTIIRHRLKYIETLKNQTKIDLFTNEDTLNNTQLSVIDRFILSQELNDKELIDETFTIFTSSQEASAKISSSLLLMMAFYPLCQEKLYREINRVIGDEKRRITNEDLKNMPYLEMVFKEVVRLYPIGALLQRTVLEDISVDAYGTIPSGSSLVIPVYHIHRDPRFWRNPEAFDPERFNPENMQLRHPNCYIPFSLGPMDCLGRYFGTKLIKTICVRVLQEYELTSTHRYEDLRISIAISASPMDGYWAKLTPRDKTKV